MSRLMNIELDLALSGRGHATGIAFRCADGTVWTGGTNEGGRPRLRVVVVDLALLPDVQIRGGEAECDEWSALDGEEAKRAFMWSLLIRGLNPERLQCLLKDASDAGERRGRNDLRGRFKTLLERD